MLTVKPWFISFPQFPTRKTLFPCIRLHWVIVGTFYLLGIVKIYSGLWYPRIRADLDTVSLGARLQAIRARSYASGIAAEFPTVNSRRSEAETRIAPGIRFRRFPFDSRCRRGRLGIRQGHEKAHLENCWNQLRPLSHGRPA
jgi:hypothetical protein